MGLFDFFKPKQKQDADLRDYMAELAAQRLAEYEPILSRGPVPDAPAGFDHFDLRDVLIGTVRGEYERYLFTGDNAAALIRDVHSVNRLAAEANAMAPGLPDFSIQNVEIAVDPFPDAKNQKWLYSYLIIEPQTATGKQKKYPVQAYVETFTGLKNARLYYTLDGRIGKGGVVVHVNPHTADCITYGFDFINGVVSHVWKNTGAGKVNLYNKNGNV